MTKMYIGPYFYPKGEAKVSMLIYTCDNPKCKCYHNDMSYTHQFCHGCGDSLKTDVPVERTLNSLRSMLQYATRADACGHNLNLFFHAESVGQFHDFITCSSTTIEKSGYYAETLDTFDINNDFEGVFGKDLMDWELSPAEQIENFRNSGASRALLHILEGIGLTIEIHYGTILFS